MKQLFEVQWSGRCYVWAANQFEAWQEAMGGLRGDNQSVGLEAAPFTAFQPIDPRWLKSIPLGREDDATCEQILAEGRK